MAYTYDQLVLAYKAVHDGIAPDAATQALFQTQAVLSANGQLTDAQLLGNIINGADNSTALAVLSYQFFTGKTPTAAGLDYLVNSANNSNDLNDAYYAKFGLENRYINFAANLGVQGEGAANFASQYGAMSFSDYVASIYQTIIGGSYAQAAGIDPAAAIASIIARKDAILATAQSAGMIPANATAAQIDLALKAATAGYLLGEAIKADVGLYAAAANNFMAALATGTAVYNTNLTYTYQPTVSSFSHGTGKAVDAAPTVLPAPPPPPTTTTPVVTQADPHTFTIGVDHFVGGSAIDAYTATDLTLNAGDTLNGGGGADSLTITAATGATYTPAAATITSIETITVTNNAGVIYNASAVTDATQLTVNSVGLTDIRGSANTNLTVSVGTAGSNTVNVTGGKDVNLTVTGNTGGDIVVGNGTAPTGAVTITESSVFGGTIQVTGGTSVNITQTAANANNTTQNNGWVYVYGTAATTSVTVHSAAPATQGTNTPGVNASPVTIYDVNGGSASTQVGKITTVNVDSYSSFSIRDNALSSLTLGHGSGGISIDNRSALASIDQTKTLNLTVNGLTGGTLSDQNIYTRMNFTTGATASTLNGINDTALTTLTVAGSSNLNLGMVSLVGLTSVTVSGAASLSANFASVTGLTTIDAHLSTGANSISLSTGNAAVTFTGGSGGDYISVNGAANDITVGTGVDTVRIFGINATSSSIYTTIHGIDFGDKLGFDHVTNATTIDAEITGLPGGSTITDYLNAAAASMTAGTTNEIHWFEFGGSTYVVLDNSNSASFVDGVDMVVKLAGVVGLSMTGDTLISGVVEL